MSHRHLQTAALALFAALASNVAAAQADTNATGVQPQPVNPYSPAYDHAYRGGVVPTRTVQARMRAWDNTHPQATQVTSANTLAYLGGPVMSGATKVYLVFYGNQWGTTYVDANGNLAFAHDPSRVAGAAQQMFKGIGTHNETWQADLTQWCDGSGIAKNATACPASPASGVNWIPYQHNVLAGVWYDSSAASPSAATTAQLGKEAVAAAAHFGNTTPESNRYTYYVILSAQGTNPDNFLTGGGYCAWHGDTKSIRVISTAGDLAFSNQPYNTDLGVGCGVGFVNTPGTTDGYTMTLGHEWHEMMSDPVPATGWFNVHNNAGGENSDECVWLDPGTPGGAANITFNTGIFAEQSSWSNDTNRCDISHAIASHQLMGNKGFESAGSWTASTGVLCTNATCSTETARTGNGFALLGGLGTANTQTLSQAVTIPAGFTTATLKYYLHTDTAETSTTAGHDKLTVALYDGPTLLKTLHSSSNLNANAGYSVRSSDLSAWIGQTLTLTFTSKENGSLQTSFAVDDVTLLVK